MRNFNRSVTHSRVKKLIEVGQQKFFDINIRKLPESQSGDADEGLVSIIHLQNLIQ